MSKRFLPQLIFTSRWLQLPLYLGLIFAQGMYVVHFFQELMHLFTGNVRLTETAIMLQVLSLIDIVMISNLLIMVIVGGYETFVSRLELNDHPDQPEWLSHVNAAILKVKLATAIVTISSIHLLGTFINAHSLDEQQLKWQTIIHIVLVLSAVGIALIEKFNQSNRRSHAKHQNFQRRSPRAPVPSPQQ